MTSRSPCSSSADVTWAKVIAATGLSPWSVAYWHLAGPGLPSLSPFFASDALPARAALEEVTKGSDSLLPVLLSVGVCYENRQQGWVVEPTIFRMSSGGVSFQQVKLFIKWPVMNAIVVSVNTIQAAAKLQTTYRKKLPSPLKILFFPLCFYIFFPELEIIRKQHRRRPGITIHKNSIQEELDWSQVNLWASVTFPVKSQ